MKICILGKHGFIGSALAKRLHGHEITSNPTSDIDVLVHLASPTHMGFEKNMEYHMNESIQSFLTLLPFCKRNDIYFMYASSALVYEPEKKTPFRNCKIILEQFAEAYGGRTLGLRIFPVYGIGEKTTAISQWCSDMMNGKRPVIYGDGNQTRDFIYIDDVTSAIKELIMEGERTGIMDIGAGKPISFNEIVKIINEELNTKLEPEYRDVPKNYSEGIYCKNPIITNYSIRHGIRKIILERSL